MSDRKPDAFHVMLAEARADMGPWAKEAACFGMDPNLFYPFPGDRQGVREAVAVCNRCEVRPDCLAYALRVHEKDGVWGGVPMRNVRARRAAQAAS